MPTPSRPASWDDRPAERSSLEECITAEPGGHASGSEKTMVRVYDADVDGILAAHGLTPQADGYNLLDLERFVTTRGWQCSIEPIGGRPARRNQRRRFRAMVLVSDDSRARQWRGRVLGMRQTRGTGPSDTGALALAVARMLRTTTEDEL